MNKRPRKLRLHRETVRPLVPRPVTREELAKAAGGLLAAAGIEDCTGCDSGCGIY
ncbi:MAG: hypothetical protein M3O15_04020 [Acidobacteriota bacterium]|nr:hypothetical protein [Acidobacteriota bacterium]